MPSLLIKNLSWEFGSKLAVQVLTFGLSIVMTRYLLPEDYGDFGLLVAIISIFSIFQDLSINEAIIQKGNCTNKVLSSAYWFMFFLGGVCFLSFFALCFLLKENGVIALNLNLILLLGSTFLFAGMSRGVVLHTSLHLNFKAISVANLISSLFASVTGVFLAKSGLGVIALIASFFLKYFLNNVLLFFHSSWKPSLSFSIKEISPFFRFSKTRSITKIIRLILAEADVLVVKTFQSEAIFGGYIKSRSIEKQLSNNMISVYSQVMYSHFSHLKNETGKLLLLLKRAAITVFLISMVLSISLFVYGENLFVLFFGEHWRESGVLFSLFSLLLLFKPLNHLLEIFLNACGEVTKTFKVEVYSKIGLIICLIILVIYKMINTFILLLFINSFIECVLLCFSTYKRILSFEDTL
ncbi:oligosaccharide flippase family protein [Flammeovirga kamogawensis]|uniref:Oligosaccharide flippase family protein n=1 Tax=Flammeovirga kamogawensis TaxID=373891 RepID=A0ABX8GWY4_9BACT|nr:oligosaccharide flippase family protein [Flammeovirga kamogawensis]MBB6460757.1 O-antigen/teichoic acid export membrane protein [Flammeovirga kamogawensis]QWG08110.1 oligosaccharide flippase family protein [Flammeovirga kamogawensis]TRX69913.1 oligosaccharide flippase family protein [Flammeovirga kamogawensis]